MDFREYIINYDKDLEIVKKHYKIRDGISIIDIKEVSKGYKIVYKDDKSNIVDKLISIGYIYKIIEEYKKE